MSLLMEALKQAETQNLDGDKSDSEAKGDDSADRATVDPDVIEQDIQEALPSLLEDDDIQPSASDGEALFLEEEEQGEDQDKGQDELEVPQTADIAKAHEPDPADSPPAEHPESIEPATAPASGANEQLEQAREILSIQSVKRTRNTRSRVIWAFVLLLAAGLCAGAYLWLDGSLEEFRAAFGGGDAGGEQDLIMDLSDPPLSGPAQAAADVTVALPSEAPLDDGVTEQPPVSAKDAPSSSPGPSKPDTTKPAAEAADAGPRVTSEVSVTVPGRALSIRRDKPSQGISERLQQAWAALQVGDLETAEGSYRLVLASHPQHRHALLGMAAVSTSQGNAVGARSYYSQVLNRHPNDAYARAGLANLMGVLNAEQSEGALQRLLDSDPTQAHVHFALGNLYVDQSRWAMAVGAYRQANLIDTTHPDFAHNLAVALDQLGQLDEAVKHYRRAIDLASGRLAGFDVQRVRDRLAEIASVIAR